MRPKRATKSPASYEQAWEQALRSLARRERTGSELVRELRRHGYEPAIVDAVLLRLRELALVDDLRYAKALVQGRRKGAHAIGRRRIEHELMAKGIEAPMIEVALSQLTAEHEDMAARRLAAELWAKHQATTDAARLRNRIYGALVRRGFDYQTAAEAVAAALAGERP